MNKTTKIILIVVGIVAVLCLCACIAGVVGLNIFNRGVQQAVKADPTEAAVTAQHIATFEVPAGYKQTAFSILGFDTVMIASEGSSSDGMFIMLMQFPESVKLNEEQMAQQMEQAAQQQYNQRGTNFKVVETKSITIRGKQVPATISEGETDQNGKLRQMLTVFTGNNGTAALMITGAQSAWDQSLVDRFIASIR